MIGRLNDQFIHWPHLTGLWDGGHGGLFTRRRKKRKQQATSAGSHHPDLSTERLMLGCQNCRHRQKIRYKCSDFGILPRLSNHMKPLPLLIFHCLIVRSTVIAFEPLPSWSANHQPEYRKRSRATVTVLQSESEPLRVDQEAKGKLQIQIEYCGG